MNEHTKRPVNHNKMNEYTALYYKFRKGYAWLMRQTRDLQTIVIEPLEECWENLSEEERSHWLKANKELINTPLEGSKNREADF